MSRPQQDPFAAADALIVVAPLANRWIERLLASHQPPLTVTQFLALRAIAAEGVSGSELARRAGVSGPAVSQLLSGLADAGLLEREELPEDRRRQTLTLSTRGQRALTSAHALLRERLTPLLAELPRPEADALTRALPHLEAALSGTPPPRRPPPPRPPGHPHSPPLRHRP
jgi:DNA-binding MarR family transcriptional regulator